MTSSISLAVVAAMLTWFSVNVLTVAPAEAKGKACHMEQQCHWENFKKVCVWVKVCR
jgi:Mn-dependent DtxR family transcriptional regulator